MLKAFYCLTNDSEFVIIINSQLLRFKRFFTFYGGKYSNIGAYVSLQF